VKKFLCNVLSFVLVLLSAAPVVARERGGGGYRASSRSSVNVNRNANYNRNVNVNRNYNENVNVNRNVNVYSHGGYYGGGYYGGGYYGGCCYHPVATAAAVTATAMVTAAVIGSVVNTLPPSCSTVLVNGYSYYQCGSTWYQPQFSGGYTSYVVVNAPR
jgi:hypothetical protein